MTYQQLKQLEFMRREIHKYNEILNELISASNSPSAPNYSGMPSAHNGTSAVEMYAIQIADNRKVLEAMCRKYAEQVNECLLYISSIEDSITRMTFELRFIEGKDWESVAESLGGNNTSDAAKKRVYRYLKDCP